MMINLEVKGLLFIGDPHLATRTPGFRKDDYPKTLINKLKWCLNYAASEDLVPILLGDVFHFPRDNANWLLVELFDLFRGSRHPVLTIIGNHDCYENQLGSNDTLAVMHSGGALKLLDSVNPWVFLIQGTHVLIGGTSWNENLPNALPEIFSSQWPAQSNRSRLVLWVTHHDIAFAGYEDNARLRPRPIPGIDVVINGHIHRTLPDIVTGETTWLNPGNIARVNRSENSRTRDPAALRMDIKKGVWSTCLIPVPCEPFDDVFFELTESQAVALTGQSVFVNGLTQLEAFKSATGAGLMHFLDTNLDAFGPAVQLEIRTLAHEVLDHDGDTEKQY